MNSYLNKPELKVAFVKEIEKHRKADQIIKGTYGKGDSGDWKGCAVGCSIHSLGIIEGSKLDTSEHSLYESKLGIPEWLARLEDTIFEGLPVEEAKQWPTAFAKAVPVGVDLNPVKYKFCAFILKENIERVLKLDIKDDLKEQVVKAIQGVLSVHEKAIQTGEWDESAERAAWSAERSAAASAESAAWRAESAARAAASAAASAERSAEWSAESAAASAAWSAESAAASAAASAERSAEWRAERAAASAAYTKYAKELLRLVKASK